MRFQEMAVIGKVCLSLRDRIQKSQALKILILESSIWDLRMAC